MKRNVVDGQISFWEVEIPVVKKVTQVNLEVTQKVVCVTKYNRKITDHQQRAIDKYKNSNNRIIHYCGGGIGIEIKEGTIYKTIYVNKVGNEEFSTFNQIPLTPMDQILRYKEDYEINSIQEQKLQELIGKYNISTYIKRKGDPNIIIRVPGKIISINKLGWVLEYNNFDIHHKEDEILKFKHKEIEYKLGDKVEAWHGSEKIIGEIFSKYENQPSFNIIWENKHSAFHVSKIIRKIA